MSASAWDWPAPGLGERAGIRRYGHITLPMDETLVTCALDLGGRSYFVFEGEFPTAKIGKFDSELVADFWHAFAANVLANVHILVHYGRNSHHIAEGIFKAAARSLAPPRNPTPGSPALPAPRVCCKLDRFACQDLDSTYLLPMGR